MPQTERPNFDLWKGLIITIGIFAFIAAVFTLVLWRKSKGVDTLIEIEKRNLDACVEAKNDPELIRLVNRAKEAILRPDQKVELVNTFLEKEAESLLSLKDIVPTSEKPKGGYSKHSWKFGLTNSVRRSKLTKYLYNVQNGKPGLVIEEINWKLDRKALKKLDPNAINKWEATIVVSTFVRVTQSASSKLK